MIKFITKASHGACGQRHYEYDVNITVNKPSKKTNSVSLRIGFRNSCDDRLKTDKVALAYDADVKRIYIIPKQFIPDNMHDVLKCYTICSSSNAGKAVKTCAPELVKFVCDNELLGFNDMHLDVTTNWYYIEPTKQPQKGLNFIHK